MLRDAKIIDESGYFHPDYFSKETVEKDKANGHPVILQCTLTELPLYMVFMD